MMLSELKQHKVDEVVSLPKAAQDSTIGSLNQESNALTTVFQTYNMPNKLLVKANLCDIKILANYTDSVSAMTFQLTRTNVIFSFRENVITESIFDLSTPRTRNKVVPPLLTVTSGCSSYQTA